MQSDRSAARRLLSQSGELLFTGEGHTRWRLKEWGERLRTEERNWDHFGWAVTQNSCICLGSRALFFLVLKILSTPTPFHELLFDDGTEVRNHWDLLARSRPLAGENIRSLWRPDGEGEWWGKVAPVNGNFFRLKWPLLTFLFGIFWIICLLNHIWI